MECFTWSLCFKYTKHVGSLSNINLWRELPISLTYFFPMLPVDPPENIRKSYHVFWCFQGDQKGLLGRKRLKQSYHETNCSVDIWFITFHLVDINFLSSFELVCYDWNQFWREQFYYCYIELMSVKVICDCWDCCKIHVGQSNCNYKKCVVFSVLCYSGLGKFDFIVIDFSYVPDGTC